MPGYIHGATIPPRVRQHIDRLTAERDALRLERDALRMQRDSLRHRHTPTPRRSPVVDCSPEAGTARLAAAHTARPTTPVPHIADGGRPIQGDDMTALTRDDLARALLMCAPSDILRDHRVVTRMLAGITRRDISQEAVCAALEAANRLDQADHDLGFGDADEQIKTRRHVQAARTRLNAACDWVLEAGVL